VPNRKGGGVTFSKTRTREDFRTQMTKKMRRLANRNALLAKLVDNEVKCIDALEFAAPKTAEFAKMMGALGIDRSCLVVTAGGNENARLSARNIDGVGTTRVEQLSAFDLLNHRYVLVDKGSLQSFIDGTCFAAGEEAN
jgi:large subunit ribosomal protein L4